MSKNVLDLVSKVVSDPELGAGHKALLEEATRQMGKVIQAKEGLEKTIGESLRPELERLEKENEELKQAAPKGDDAGELQRLRDLEAAYEGISPQDAVAYRNFKNEREANDTFTEAWTVAKLDPDAARSLEGAKALEYQVLEAKDDQDKPIKVSQVKENGRWVPLTTYAEQHYGRYMPILKGQPTEPEAPRGPGPVEPETTGFTERSNRYPDTKSKEN